jgi:putative DNA primase/helicase
MSKPANVAAIARDREELWAEAKHWYRAGFDWWLSPSLEAIAGDMQNAFLEEDVWDALIEDWIQHRAPRDQQTEELLPFTTHAVLWGIGYGLTPGEEDKPIIATKADQIRAATCLRRLGYRRDRNPRRVQGRRERFWGGPKE